MTAFTNIERAEIENNNKLLKTWHTTLESIQSKAVNGKNLGANLYAHSRIIDLKNGILLVEADHPGWIQTLRLYQKYIITGLKRGVPEVKITSLAFRLKGTNAELHSQISEEQIRKDINNRIQKEENVIREFDTNNRTEAGAEKKSENKEMPENLRKILDRLKTDMMAESK